MTTRITESYAAAPRPFDRERYYRLKEASGREHFKDSPTLTDAEMRERARLQDVFDKAQRAEGELRNSIEHHPTRHGEYQARDHRVTIRYGKGRGVKSARDQFLLGIRNRKKKQGGGDGQKYKKAAKKSGCVVRRGRVCKS